MNSYRLSLCGGQQAADRTSEPFMSFGIHCHILYFIIFDGTIPTHINTIPTHTNLYLTFAATLEHLKSFWWVGWWGGGLFDYSVYSWSLFNQEPGRLDQEGP